MTEPEQIKPGDVAAARIDGMAAGFDNVIPFARTRRHGGEIHVPPVTIAPADRPPPPPPGIGLPRWIAIAACSLAAHGVFLMAFWELPRPLAGAGLETIAVELVFGADRLAGVAPTPGENEVQSAPPLPETKPDARREERPDDARETPLPDRRPAAHSVATADPLDDRPTGQIAAPEPAMPNPPLRPSPGVASEAASGIGRGRSAAEENYGGRVTSHLARHRQYTASLRSREIEGSGAVTFSIDGDGRVTAVGVVRSTGAAVLDRELVAMVRRASPFPPPPAGRPMRFVVPVNFRLN